ncbi:sigma-54-dependent transcriptional regulator [Pedosphaera parvula]|uniref:Two component, sigma54 specific, transcriptional regulator, Fis family n=1 Tax=Pedosphaera parvula (strain Ellin514) TaxID=320771 RepID=B9XIA4_PEDPL|nr:sigma-54 dependent transcriptional regulator [Pedosphaera parvula]EEF60365.1 two component, sigma54 specific, transcriptional regulator, Fis family [Pedosphaera parvula Ellin514]
MRANILVIDDDAEIRELLVQILQRSSYQVSQVKDGAGLKEAINRLQPEIVLLDFKLPDATGLDLLPFIKKEWPESEVIMLTGHATYDVAVEAIKRGAFHFQEKPFDPESLLNLIKRALEIRSLREAVSTGNAIFQCDVMKNVVRTVRRVAPSDVSILITGESGTGKEVIADLIHSSSHRASGPLIKINCAALPRELIESELFGSVKGAFTGAHSDREGLFRQAEGGTLLLDELSEMPIDTQSKLLRVLQEKEVRPVGGRTSYKTDCRIIAATNRKPEEAIRDGKMREDLFYRISAVSVHLPPLRERREDILPLATAFLKRFSAQANRDIAGFTPEAAERLRSFDWPGNVRQLQNEVQRAVLLCEGKLVDAPDLSITAPANESTGDTSYTLLEGVERNTIVQMLKETGGNKLETAKRLGIGRQTLYNKIKAYGIET